MHRVTPPHRVAALALLLALSACTEGNVIGIDDPECDKIDCTVPGSGGKNGSGGASGSNASGSGGKAANGTGGKTGNAAAGSGGNSGNGAGGSGAGGSGNASDAGADATLPPIPDYTLVVDSPSDGDAVSGEVVVVGRAPKFVNVEISDATHQDPPLARVTPNADGTFSATIDTADLAQGATTWTINAWDSAAGEDFTNTASATLDLTIGDGGVVVPGGAIGSGDIADPVDGPAPSDADTVGGAAFVLVKNWDFGSDDTVTDLAVLTSEFDYHDNFGTIANGTNYGSVTVAPTAATAISAPNLGLPNNMQPVEDPAHPVREFTASTLKAYVVPLNPADTTCKVTDHDTGNGSITAKWRLPKGGSLLGKDLLWEARVRMPKPLLGYWYAIWTVGNKWNMGAEMDVMESFGGTNIWPDTNLFHSDAVPSSASTINYFGGGGWPAGLNQAGLPPSNATDLTQWHTYTWLYRKNDTYVVYFDGHDVQHGTIHWTNGGGSGAEAIDMAFLFDFGWGHTQVNETKDVSLPCSDFPMTYEVDYSRVYLRQ